MAIKTVIFDLDDTLLWDKKSIADAFAKTCVQAAQKYPQIDGAKLEDYVRSAARTLYEGYETYDYTVQIGINPFEGLWGHFDDPTEDFQKMKAIVPTYRRDAWVAGLKEYGIDDTAFGHELGEKFVENRIASPCVYDETYAVLDSLKEDYQLILLTNGAPSLQNKKLEITPELVPYFDKIIISGDFGIGKPDASIFEYVLTFSEGNAEECIMVGDNLMTDILGSSRVNMRNVWINREDKAPNDVVVPTYEIDTLTKLKPLIDSL